MLMMRHRHTCTYASFMYIKTRHTSRSSLFLVCTCKPVHESPRDTQAFRILEVRFANFDHDGAQTLMFSELQTQLASAGFRSMEKLAQLFKRVDFDSNGSLDFSEFLALLYLWAMNENADYSAFFRHPASAAVIKQAFEAMEQCMIHYDKDGSRKLSIMEVVHARAHTHTYTKCFSSIILAWRQTMHTHTQNAGGRPCTHIHKMHNAGHAHICTHKHTHAHAHAHTYTYARIHQT